MPYDSDCTTIWYCTNGVFPWCSRGDVGHANEELNAHKEKIMFTLVTIERLNEVKRSIEI